MTDHIWAQEQIASYLTGGLVAEERERLDRHAKECPECAASLASAVHFDRGLGTLFMPFRPKPGLEDRAVQRVRIAPRPHSILIIGWPRRITAVAGILLATTTFGLLTLAIIAGSDLPVPGEERKVAKVQRESEAAPAAPEPQIMGGRDLSNEDPGLNSNLESAVDLERLTQKTVEDITGTNTANTGKRGQGIVGWNENGKPRDGYRNYNGNFSNSGNLGGGGFAGGIGGGFAGNGAMPGKDNRNTQLFSFYTGNFGEGNAAQPGVSLPPVVPTSAPSPPAVVPANPNTGPGSGLDRLSTTTNGYFVPGETFQRENVTLRARTEEMTNKLTKANEETPKSKDDSLKGDIGGIPAPKISTPAPPEPAAPVVVPEPTRRVVLRSGDIEFEIESFDSALATITQLVTKIKGGFVGTVNSEKLPNGKVKGSITVRTPPEFLDNLVLDLRKELGKGGELKSVRLASQDVTKQYTDLESRLRASRAMETRLLEIIKTGKGEIKQLLEAERELGLWRTKIEESEGELRYFANLASLSTLTITLMEKEIRAAVGVTENERVQAGVEVEDVDKVYQQVLKEVLDAKGRVLKSELKQLSAGQFNAMLNFEVAPEAGGPIRDRLRQLGRVARLEIDRQQQADGGTMPKTPTVKRGDTLFMVQLYNLANVAPRETATLAVAVADVPASYNAIRDAIAKAAGRVQVAQLHENDKTNVTAQLDFDVKRTDEGAIRAALTAAGDISSRTVSRAAESDQVTDTKILYRVSLSSVSRLRARDAVGLQIAVNDVSATYNTLRETVIANKSRILTSNLDENDKQNVNASLDFEIRRTDEAALKGSLEAAGEVVSRQIAHAAENEAATDSKVLYNVRLLAANRLHPRETTVLGLEVADVDNTVAVFTAQFNEVKGRQIDAKTGRERNGKTTARLVYEVPLTTASGLVEKFKGAGTVRALNSARDPQAPEGKSATARIEITLANADSIVETEDGLWSPVKKGLTYSASFLLRSMTWVVFVLCVVLPWALIGYGGYRLVKRAMRSEPSPTLPTEPPASH